ncbi:MAG: hypothetical protein H7242_13665 [Microbacteriaceae bacterium]|nr:hypothetical protein [Burkholderiaceae bacterium]
MTLHINLLPTAVALVDIDARAKRAVHSAQGMDADVLCAVRSATLGGLAVSVRWPAAG